MNKKDKWKKIRNSKCKECSLYQSAQTVCVLGRGKLNADIFLVGEAPGLREDDLGKPFAGRSGELLDDILKQLGSPRKEVYISNVVHCRPENNRTPTKNEIKACIDYLTKEIDLVKPKMIIAMGNTALNGLTKRSGITKHRGSILDYESENHSCVIMPTFHPAAILRNPSNIEYLVEDITRAVEYVSGELEKEEIDWILVDTIDKVEKVVKNIVKIGITAFDVETTGLNPWNKNNPVMCSMGFSWKRGTGVSIPLYHDESPYTEKQIKYIFELLNKMIFENEHLIKVAHNLKFDGKWARKYGMNIRGEIFDTMLAHYLLNENARHDLNSLSLQYTNYGEYWRGVDELGLGNGFGNEIPLKKLSMYNAIDCDVTLRLKDIFESELRKQPKVYKVFKHLLMPASKLFIDIEERGMFVNIKYLKKLEKEFETELNNMYDKMMGFKACKRVRKYLGKKKGDKDFKFNFGSPQQLAELLFGDYGFNYKLITKGYKYRKMERTSTGAPSTTEDSIIELMLNHTKNKLLPMIIEYRKISKLNSTYVKGMWKHIGPDNRIRPNFKLHGTVTGRLSCTEPNLQNIPRTRIAEYDSPLKMKIKKIFIASPGYKLVEVDYSQAELRVMADMANELRMIEWFNTGKDVHYFTATEMVGRDKVTEAERKRAKSVNFGVIYDVGKYTLAVSLSSPSQGIFFTPDQSEEFLDLYFRRFPAVKKNMNRLKRKAKKKGYVETKFGRRRRLPNLNSDTEGVVNESLRQAVNSPIQGTACDYALMSMVMGSGYLGNKKYLSGDARIINTVHDSILLEIKSGAVKKLAKLFKDLCENLPTRKYFGFKSGVPMKVDIKYGNNWKDLKELKL